MSILGSAAPALLNCLICLKKVKTVFCTQSDRPLTLNIGSHGLWLIVVRNIPGLMEGKVKGELVGSMRQNLTAVPIGNETDVKMMELSYSLQDSTIFARRPSRRTEEFC